VSEERSEPAHLVDRDARADPLRARVIGPAQDQEARVRVRGHLPARRRGGRNFQAPPGRIALARLGQQVPRQAIGERRLADASPADEQPAVMHPAAGEGLGKRRLCRLVAVEDARFAGMREAFEAVRLGQLVDLLDGGGAAAGHQRPAANKRRSVSAQMSAATWSAGRAPSIRAQRCGSAFAMAR
jgi:hypothetical protein